MLIAFKNGCQLFSNRRKQVNEYRKKSYSYSERYVKVVCGIPTYPLKGFKTENKITPVIIAPKQSIKKIFWL
jgi:hypothetical protein